MVWNLGGQAGLVVLNFLLVPFLIRGLGLEGYALYGYLGMIAGTLTLLTFGSGTATLKFTSEFVGCDDKRGLSEVLGGGAVMHTVGVVIGASAVFIFRESIVDSLLHVDGAHRADALWIAGCGAASALFFALIQFGVSFFQGLQRFAYANALRVLQAGLVLGGGGLLLAFGYGLRAVGAWFVILQAVLALGAIIGVTIAARPLTDKGILHLPNAARARKFSGFAIKTFFAQLAWSIVFQWDKFLIGFFLPLGQLTFYLVPASVLQRLWVIPSSVGDIAFPMISEMSSRGESDSMETFFRLCSLMVLWLVIPGFIILALFAPQFLTLWIGSEFSDQGVWPMRWLTLGYFFYLLALIPATAAYAVGKPQYALANNLAQAATCIILWPILIPRYGITGAALGFCAAQTLTGIPYCLFITRRLFGMSAFDFASRILMRPLAAGAILLALLWPFRMQAYGWTGLIGLSAIGSLIYYGLTFKILAAEEREMALMFLGKVRNRLTPIFQPR